MLRRTNCSLIPLFLLGTFVQTVVAGELDPKPILAKAYAAIGGDKAAKPENATWKEEGTYYGMGGDGLPYTSTCASQPPDKFRMEIPGVFTIVVNGDKGWSGAAGGTAEMTKEQLAAQKEMCYAIQVTQLSPLVNEKGYTVTALNDEKVNDRPAFVLRVSHDGHKDVTLFIDQENYLVVKSMYRVRSEEQGKEVDEEDFYSDYKELNGRKHPTAITIHRDGKKFVEAKVSDYKPAEKLDEKLFEKP